MARNKPNLVIDTNILISAVLSPKSIPAQAVSKALLEYRVYVSESTLAEFRAVIMRPKFDKMFMNRLDERAAFIEDFMNLAVIVNPLHPITDCQDPKDNQFLEVAVTCQAAYLVTGDKKDLLSMNPYKGIAIITAREFIEVS